VGKAGQIHLVIGNKKRGKNGWFYGDDFVHELGLAGKTIASCKQRAAFIHS
jgi:hypothetical protein